MYLPTAPRAVSVLPLYGSARCDVLLRCDGSAPTVTLTGVTYAFPSTNIDGNWDVMTFAVAPSDLARADLPVFSVRTNRKRVRDPRSNISNLLKFARNPTSTTPLFLTCGHVPQL
jgi:hypothetical protein